MKNKFEYTTKYEHTIRHSRKGHTMIWSGWIFLIVWTFGKLYELISNGDSYIILVYPTSFFLLFWQQMILLVVMMFLSSEKKVKEECLAKMEIKEDGIEIIYKGLNYYDERHDGLVNTKVFHPFKRMRKLKVFNEGIRYVGNHSYTIYDKDGKQISKEKRFASNEVKIYIPQNKASEILNVINSKGINS